MGVHKQRHIVVIERQIINGRASISISISMVLSRKADCDVG